MGLSLGSRAFRKCQACGLRGLSFRASDLCYRVSGLWAHKTGFFGLIRLVGFLRVTRLVRIIKFRVS